MSVLLVGTSHHHAPVEVRERVALDGPAAAAVAARLADAVGEAVCLSTCNRTEIYVAGDGGPAESAARAVFVELGGTEIEPLLYRLHGGAAALHAMRVAAGLDSMVPGEGEILGQVRSALEAGKPGPQLDRLFRQALYAGKKVRAETAISESPTSVASAAAALAKQVFGDLDGRSVLVVGAGQTAELAARNLAKRGAEIVAIANRAGGERGPALASQVGARALSLEDLEGVLNEVDVVISSTSAGGYVLGAPEIASALARRKGMPLLLIDIAVPRDVDPAVHALDGCYLFDIDDLQSVVEHTLAGRLEEASRAEAIAAAEAERFIEWQSSREVVPAIAELRERAEAIRAGELARAEGVLARLSDSERRLLESVTAGIVNKLLHLPTVRLKEAAAGADGTAYADTVRHLFGLDERTEDERS
jgi:glutamyl-tRNA reductase